MLTNDEIIAICNKHIDAAGINMKVITPLMALREELIAANSKPDPNATITLPWNQRPTEFNRQMVEQAYRTLHETPLTEQETTERQRIVRMHTAALTLRQVYGFSSESIRYVIAAELYAKQEGLPV